jgi:hypothetical protein
MYYRADVKGVVEYIQNNSEQMKDELCQKYPDFKPSVELSFANNLLGIRVLLRQVIDVWQDADGSCVDDDDDEFSGKHYTTNYVVIPDSIDRFNSEAKIKYLKETPPSYSGFKMHLRNCLLWSYGNEVDSGTTVTINTDIQYKSSYRLRGTITVVDSKLSAVVEMASKVTNNYNSVWSEYVEVYKIPAVKLTKFLKKIGYTELFCTKAAGKVSNKPMRLSVHFTDLYIPECYIQMSSKVSSCMAKRSDSFDLPYYEHPCLAYEGSPDVMLALVKDEDSTADFPYINRIIVRMISGGIFYNTSYGNQILRDLSPFGITQEDGCMNGVKLKLIESDNGGILAPYVDGTNCSFYEDGEYLVCCDDSGDKASCYETGRLEGDFYCTCCDSNVIDVTTADAGNDVCAYCLSEYYTYVSTRDGYVHNDYVVEVEDDGGFTSAAHMNDAVYSDCCEISILGDYATWSDILDSYIHDSQDEHEVYLRLNGHAYGEEDESDDEEEEEVVVSVTSVLEQMKKMKKDDLFGWLYTRVNT